MSFIDQAPYPTAHVLHVAESFGGGVGNAILDYVRNTPEYGHHLLYAERSDSPIQPTQLEPFLTTTKFSKSHLTRIREVARTARATGSRIVHAHSSFAGVYTRLGVDSSRLPIVYTPHCYASERRDVNAALRAACRTVESLLALNTTVFAACSPREADLSRRMPRGRVIYVPNVPPPDTLPDTVHGRHLGDHLRVVGAGRDAKQKDPDFFLACVEALRGEGIPVEATWIGGSPAMAERFRKSGIHVTGWLKRSDALAAVAKADLYVHSAAWEGFPVAILEAARLKVPILARNIPALDGLSIPKFDGTVEFIEEVYRLRKVDGIDTFINAVSAALETNTDVHQGTALRAVYALETDRWRPNEPTNSSKGAASDTSTPVGKSLREAGWRKYSLRPQRLQSDRGVWRLV